MLLFKKNDFYKKYLSYKTHLETPENTIVENPENKFAQK